MSISAVVISYKNPAYLDLCLKSLTTSKVLPDTEIIVVLDGFAEMSEAVVNKYPGINVLAFEENKGQTAAHNEGVLAASGEWVLVLNDDNVAPLMWDDALLEATRMENCVISPNQCEPRPSMFPSFVIKDFGITPETFQYDKFMTFEDDLFFRRKFVDEMEMFTQDGSTWPLFIQKKHYLMLGGIDQYFPCPAFADVDFFLRCELAGLQCLRYHGLHFWHFAGAATRKIDSSWNYKEQQSMEYFYYKWKVWPQRDKNNSVFNHLITNVYKELPTV